MVANDFQPLSENSIAFGRFCRPCPDQSGSDEYDLADRLCPVRGGHHRTPGPVWRRHRPDQIRSQFRISKLAEEEDVDEELDNGFSFDNIFAQTNHRRENKSFNFCVSLSLLFPEIFFALFT